MSGSRNTSILMSACFRLWIRIDNIRYFLLWHNHVRMLYIARMTGHLLCRVLFSTNGFIPSVLKANLIFLLSAGNSGYWRSKFFHWVPSVGCQISSSFSLRFSECQCTSSASLGLENTCFKQSITGRYDITKVGIFLFVMSCLSRSASSSTLSGPIAVLFLFFYLFLHSVGIHMIVTSLVSTHTTYRTPRVELILFAIQNTMVGTCVYFVHT
jgi:hypothetical protein